MKIRIKGNSLRYRLSRSEVEKFIDNEMVEDKIEFGHTVLFYTLQQTKEQEISASFSNNRILFNLPQALVQKWKNDDTVGFKYDMKFQNGQSLFLLVEKDFTCIDKVEEDQSDNYPNPLLKQPYE